LISQQEQEAWDVLLACQGQLRLAPSGHVIGIDMEAVLQLAGARACDMVVVSELLPAAEAGLVEPFRLTRLPGLILDRHDRCSSGGSGLGHASCCSTAHPYVARTAGTTFRSSDRF
jgi:hypothetical protein